MPDKGVVTVQRGPGCYTCNSKFKIHQAAFKADTRYLVIKLGDVHLVTGYLRLYTSMFLL